MDKIVKMLNFIGCGILCVTIFFGYCAGYEVNYFITHIYVALIAASLTLLGQVAIFFYLLATGASIKEMVNEIDFGEGVDAIKETKIFKMKTFPIAMLSIIFLIATTALGGAVHTGVVMPWIHGAVAWTALGVSLYSTINAGKYFERNKVLIMKVIENTPQQVEV